MPSTSHSLLDRDRRVLSTITEHTEDLPSRTMSFAASSRPVTQYSSHSSEAVRRSTYLPAVAGPSHIRSSTDPATRPQTPGRAGVSNLIAHFESVTAPAHGHGRTVSAPAGPRSPSPYATTPFSQTIPTLSTNASGLGYTTSSMGSAMSYGSSVYSYSSRPSSPTKLSRTGSVISGPRAPSSVSADSRRTPGTHSRSQSEVSGYSGTPSRSATSTFTGLTGGASVTGTEATTMTPTPTLSTTSLRRPQGSRSPLTQVKNVVSAFKAKTPVLRKTQTATSPTPSEGRRRSRRSITPNVPGGSSRGRQSEAGLSDISSNPGGTPKSEPPAVADTPPPFDVTQLGETGEVRYCLF